MKGHSKVQGNQTLHRRVVKLRDGDAVRIGDIVVRRVSESSVRVTAPVGCSITIEKRGPQH